MVIAFWISSFLAIGAGLIVVTNRNLFHAALALMVSFLGVAGIYLSLDAGFMAAAQLLIYIGAISILVIFGVAFLVVLAVCLRKGNLFKRHFKNVQKKTDDLESAQNELKNAIELLQASNA